MKKIKIEQLNTLLHLFKKYNVGIQEFEAIQEMFNQLPDCEKCEEKKCDKKEGKRDK